MCALATYPKSQGLLKCEADTRCRTVWILLWQKSCLLSVILVWGSVRLLGSGLARHWLAGHQDSTGQSIKSASCSSPCFPADTCIPGSAGEQFGELPRAHVLLCLGASLYREVISKWNRVWGFSVLWILGKIVNCSPPMLHELHSSKNYLYPCLDWAGYMGIRFFSGKSGFYTCKRLLVYTS